MEIVIVILLTILIVCVLFLIVEIKHKNKEENETIRSIENMEQDLKKMNLIFNNTKQRGNWGEYQLEYLLNMYASENKEVFQMQYPLENKKIADAILYTYDHQILCIDSKFPMENYLKMIEDKENQEYYFRLFKNNMKKHIQDISQKYITPQTMNQAILFIPSEAIYQFVCAKCSDLFQEALSSHVLLASPTTLVGIVYTILSQTKDFYRQEHVEEIEKDLKVLLEDVNRLLQRSEKAQNNLNLLQDQFEMVHTSCKKIGKRIQKITEGEQDDHNIKRRYNGSGL
ncbi:MAG: DNA recombination protein RmuC [Floccifex porci]|uniref:DNA recombination protein RmuC n=1 Tax=Floccifex porci TaxID=2606629 RepID=A0A7X2N2B2_9FIRM|nr:DNA recombination protein RmuC [Floccifex porci]MCI7801819.1 DNA recombination protein RmuC [Erysipelotrichaceae bacterium]MDY4797343.1 DNA recombination protein RmuC [Floccifex porci]MSS01140.1 DNA recombination protein RmuC [Floccifex porci]